LTLALAGGCTYCPIGGALTHFSYKLGLKNFFHRPGGAGAPNAPPGYAYVDYSACATTVDNSSVYAYYLRGIVPVCFRCPSRTVGFSGTRFYLCKYNRPSWATHLLASIVAPDI